MMARSVVVLPTPLRPSSVTVSPRLTSRSTPCSAWPSPYQAWRSRTASSGSLMLGPFMLGAHVSDAHALVLADGGVVAGRQHLTALHDGDPVAEIGNHSEVVLDHQHGAIFCQRADDARDHADILMAHAGHRLVEQQHLRVERQCGRDLQHALAAIREIAGETMRGVIEADDGKQ